MGTGQGFLSQAGRMDATACECVDSSGFGNKPWRRLAQDLMFELFDISRLKVDPGVRYAPRRRLVAIHSIGFVRLADFI